MNNGARVGSGICVWMVFSSPWVAHASAEAPAPCKPSTWMRVRWKRGGVRRRCYGFQQLVVMVCVLWFCFALFCFCSMARSAFLQRQSNLRQFVPLDSISNSILCRRIKVNLQFIFRRTIAIGIIFKFGAWSQTRRARSINKKTFRSYSLFIYFAVICLLDLKVKVFAKVTPLEQVNIASLLHCFHRRAI